MIDGLSDGGYSVTFLNRFCATSALHVWCGRTATWRGISGYHASTFR